ncbi:MAG: MerR family transcriptional regulator [Terricaulis sp.]
MFAIGQVARETGLKVPTIRFYEAEGLVTAPPRTPNGRRTYSAADIRRLAFIRHARGLGFELDDIRSLLDLTDHPDRPCAEADAIASGHLKIVEERIAQLTQLKTELTRIVRSCAGGKSARQCRVIEALAGADQRVHPHPAPRKAAKKQIAPKRRKTRRS